MLSLTNRKCCCVAGTKASGRRLGPFINHREGETHLGGHLLGAALLKNLAQDFV